MASERFMQKHYGANGFVPEVPEELQLAAVKYCRENDVDITLGQMRAMAMFAHEQIKKFRGKN